MFMCMYIYIYIYTYIYILYTLGSGPYVPKPASQAPSARRRCTSWIASLDRRLGGLKGVQDPLGSIRLMDKILHDPKDPKLWELRYIPYNG